MRLEPSSSCESLSLEVLLVLLVELESRLELDQPSESELSSQLSPLDDEDESLLELDSCLRLLLDLLYLAFFLADELSVVDVLLRFFPRVSSVRARLLDFSNGPPASSVRFLLSLSFLAGVCSMVTVVVGAGGSPF